MSTLTNLDFSKTYKLEPKVHKDGTGLSDQGISKYPGTTLNLGAGYNPQTGKYRTGLDPQAPDVLQIEDPAEREALQKRLIEIKDGIEAYLGSPGILDPKSEYWDTYVIGLMTGKGKESFLQVGGKTFSLNPTENPMHKLALIVLRANNFLPFSKAEAGQPRYKDSKFYLMTEQEEATMASANVKLDIQRGSELGKLFGDEIQYQRAWEIAFYLDLKPKKGISEEVLQEKLYLATKEEKVAQAFVRACKLPNEDILTANIFKKAVNLNIIKYNGVDKIYYRGTVNFRPTQEESIAFLKTEAMALEFASLNELVAKRSKNSTNLA